MNLELSPEQLEKLTEFAILYGIKIIAALAIFLIGKWIAGKVSSWSRVIMEKNKFDQALVSFLSNIIHAVLMIVIILAAASKLGFQTTSLVAILGAAGLAVGMALSGSLSNFASGVMIIMFRPFKVGDFIECAGRSGIVEEIGILFTEMRTPDNKQIIVPNSSVMGDSIMNVSAKPTRRVDMVFGIGYGDDIKKAETVLKDLVSNDSRILKEPEAVVAVSELADSSVNFVVRPWVNAADYWNVYFDMHKNVKLRFDEEGITIPFPQQDVHLHAVKEDIIN